MPPLLRDDLRFRRFWVGQTVSMVGDQVTAIALPLVAVLTVRAGAVDMGRLAAAAWVPYLLFSLLAGAWVDRRGGRRRFMIAADLGRAAVVASVPVAWALGALSLPQLYAVAFLTGTFGVVFSVAATPLLIALVPRERYVQASSLVNGSRAFSFLSGPSLGGLLVQALSAPLALAADVLSYLVSALALWRIRVVEPSRAEGRARLLGGIDFIVRDPVMRACLAATATVNLCNFALNAILVLYATAALHVAPGVLGTVLGAGAVGGIAGSIVTGRIAAWIGVGPAFALGCVLFPAPLVLIPLAGGPRWLVLLMLFGAELGAGFGVMILDISINALFAARVPDRLRSRVTGAYALVNYGVRPLGAVVGGTLAGTFGLRPTLAVAACGALLGALWLLPSPVPRLRDVSPLD